MEGVRRGAERATGWGLLVGGALFLLGLGGCGGAASDPAAGPPLSAVTGQAGATALVEPAGLSPTAPAPAESRRPGSAEVESEVEAETEKEGAVLLGAETGVSPATPAGGRPPVAAQSSADRDAQREAREHQREAREQWYAAMREAPEAGTRLSALEVWARQPDDALDPVTYGLVDEDDTVRARAQELYEHHLRREAQQGLTP